MSSTKTENELRTILGCFLFTGDDVYKKIKVLSGGEKARVALAKTLVHEANFLLLDEPTNHLDIQSMNILIQALQQFEGTFITVSHDRYFIANVANKIWWIEEDDIKEYLGTYDEWKYFMQQRQKTQTQVKSNKIEKPKEQAIEPKNDNNDAVKLKKQLQKQIEVLEKEIEALQLEKTIIESQLAQLQNHNDFGTVSEQYKQIELQINAKNKDFEVLFEQLIQL
jgi:ATP-binding cassette subfamily F protein 3